MAKKKKDKKPSSDAVFASIQQQFGLTDALLSLDKTDPKKGFTLREAFDRIRRQKITDPARAAQILAKTNWFKQHGVDVTKRLAAEKAGSGEFKENVSATLAGLRDTLAAKGISLSEADLKALARDAYVYGMNASQMIDRMVSAKSSKFTGGGEVGDSLNSLDAMANEFGVSISSTDRLAWQRDIARGAKTETDFENTLRDNAAQKYTVFADRIQAGENMSDLIRPYRQMAAEILELGDADLDWNDPQFKDGKAFTQVGPDGKPAVKPLWQFRKELMQDSRWQNTDNAKQTYTDFGLQVLKRFGVVG